MDRSPSNEKPKPVQTSDELKLRYFQFILENSRQIIGILSKEGIVLELNAQALIQRELSRDGIVGHYLWDTVWWRGRSEAQQLLRDAVQEASQGKTSHFTTQILGNDGGIATINFSLRPIRTPDGEINYLLPEVRDITDLIATIEELRKSQKMLEQANSIAGLGYWIWNLQTDQVQISDELTFIFSEDGNARVNNYQELMRYIHPEDRVVVRRAIRMALPENGKFSLHFRITRADGTERTLQCLGEVICDDKNNPMQVIGTVQDISEIKSLENRLLESEKRYRYLVRELPHTGVVLYDRELIVFLVEGDDFVQVSAGENSPIGQPVSAFLTEDSGRGSRTG